MLNRIGSRRKKLVYRIGSDAGFFSEFNCMVLAMAYCLSENIDFILNSNYANFKYKKGWEDYFLPFCKENKVWYNKNYNYRGYKLVSHNTRIKADLIKKVYRIDYFTQDIWSHLWEPAFINKNFDIEGASSGCTLLQVAGKITNSIWQLQPKVKHQVELNFQKIELPAEYVGFHIRRGDKYKEGNIYKVEDYFNLAESKTAIRNAFIASDDFNVVEEAKLKFPAWNVFTLTNPSKTGYDQQEFNSTATQTKFNSIVDLLSDVEMLLKSTIFIGSSNSNVGMFIGMKKLDSKCFYVDSSKWRVWNV